jgi:hypothetical protein
MIIYDSKYDCQRWLCDLQIYTTEWMADGQRSTLVVRWPEVVGDDDAVIN